MVFKKLGENVFYKSFLFSIEIFLGPITDSIDYDMIIYFLKGLVEDREFLLWDFLFDKTGSRLFNLSKLFKSLLGLIKIIYVKGTFFFKVELFSFIFWILNFKNF